MEMLSIALNIGVIIADIAIIVYIVRRWHK